MKDINSCTIDVRLHTPALINTLGEDSFCHPFSAPRETLLNSSRPASNIATGLRYTWSHLTTNLQDAVIQEQAIDVSTYLLSQDVTRAGFEKDGSLNSSVTNTIEIELESHRSLHLSKWTGSPCIDQIMRARAGMLAARREGYSYTHHLISLDTPRIQYSKLQCQHILDLSQTCVPRWNQLCWADTLERRVVKWISIDQILAFSSVGLEVA